MWEFHGKGSFLLFVLDDSNGVTRFEFVICLSL
jgi:hypothetical protein